MTTFRSKCAVVNFTNDNTVEAVPSKWVIRESLECFWPPKTWPNHKIKEAINCSNEPNTIWKIFKIRILGEYDQLRKARKKATKAMTLSDLSSNNEAFVQKMKTPTQTQTYSTSSENESESSDEAFPKLPTKITSRVFPNIDSESAREATLDQLSTPSSSIKLSSKSPTVISNTKYVANEIDADFKKQVMRQFLIIRSIVHQQSEAIDLLLKRTTESPIQNNHSLESEEFVSFTKILPLKNQEDLDAFENFISEESNFQTMVKFLCRSGGNSVKEIVRRIMYSTFTNEIGMEFSWEGAKKKKIFKKLKAAKCILNAVRLNKRTENAQDDEIINQIKGWLLRAKERTIQQAQKQEFRRPEN